MKTKIVLTVVAMIALGVIAYNIIDVVNTVGAFVAFLGSNIGRTLFTLIVLSWLFLIVVIYCYWFKTKGESTFLGVLMILSGFFFMAFCVFLWIHLTSVRPRIDYLAHMAILLMLFPIMITVGLFFAGHLASDEKKPETPDPQITS